MQDYTEYDKYMRLAIKEAEIAAKEGEVPVGAVIIKDGEVVSVGRNRRESGKNALYHAEIEAIDKACKKLGGWRLWQCDMFVTLEPCPMCTGAIINSRIKKVVFGAYDRKGGACGSVLDLTSFPFNHKPQVISGVLMKECADLLKDFFKNLRENNAKF